MITIKRYSNRKLYSTDSSKYVTLKDILQLAKSGVAFIVIDMKTRKDLTNETILKANYQEKLSEVQEGASYV